MRMRSFYFALALVTAISVGAVALQSALIPRQPGTDVHRLRFKNLNTNPDKYAA